MADVRTFRAATMRDALDLVREELGADAVILHTRQVARRRLLPWRKPLEEVEITATLTLDVVPREPRRPQRRAAAPNPVARVPVTKPAAPLAVGSRLDLTSEPTESLEDLLTRSAALARFTPSRSVDSPGRRRQANSAAPDSGESRRPFDVQEPAARLNRFTGRPIGNTGTLGEEADPTAALSRRLDSIQKMLHDLGRANQVPRHDQVPAELFQVFTELIDAEVEEDVARDLIYKLKRTATPAQLVDANAVRALLTALVESEIRCREPIAPKPGRRRVVALVGATGVGKTTTIAKLAANFRLRSGIKLGLVTDTYRVAAVEQLRTYAEIIDLPMKVVTNPLEMRRALDELAGLDLVLIDTAGRSPKDELQIQELKSLLAEAHVDEVHLVLSMTSSRQSLEAAVDKFKAAGITAVILTKLDEASGMGAVMSLARRVELPISYLTAGQAVPDDIEPAHPRRIARLILGQERAAK
jgi:flagellar biosynthesis protein FlhF